MYNKYKIIDNIYMNIVVIDSGKGGRNFIEKFNKKDIKVKFCKISYLKSDPFGIVSFNSKEYIRNHILETINNYSCKNTSYIIMACHTVSSCILDLLLKNCNMLNNIRIFEPIVPVCEYIKEKKYKKILVLSTIKTARVRWHERILSDSNIIVEYISFPQLDMKIENHKGSIEESLERLKSKSEFIKECDGVVLGCTHYNVIKDDILKSLKMYNFRGDLIDSNVVLYKYFMKSIK